MKWFNVMLVLMLVMGGVFMGCDQRSDTERAMDDLGDAMEDTVDAIGDDLEESADNLADDVEDLAEELE